MTREAVMDWKNWRDVIASERVIEPGDYKRRDLHTWTRKRHEAHDRPGPMHLSSYARAKLGDGRHVSLDVELTPQAIEAIGKNTIHIDRDTISVEVIVWDDGRALVVASHNQIIGSVWLAKIDASTIPTFPAEEE